MFSLILNFAFAPSNCLFQDREILACAPTGSGKTVAFCLPLLAHLRKPLNKGFRALIISPTRELASQVNPRAVLAVLNILTKAVIKKLSFVFRRTESW